MPPAAVLLAAVGALVGCVPGVFVAGSAALWVIFSFLAAVSAPFAGGGTPGALVEVVLALQGGLLAIGLPVLLGTGAVFLLGRRDRWVLVLAGLPVTAFAAWRLVDAVLLDGGQAWLLLLVAGPAAAPLLALLPSVGRWIASAQAQVPVRG